MKHTRSARWQRRRVDRPPVVGARSVPCRRHCAARSRPGARRPPEIPDSQQTASAERQGSRAARSRPASETAGARGCARHRVGPISLATPQCVVRTRPTPSQVKHRIGASLAYSPATAAAWAKWCQTPASADPVAAQRLLETGMRVVDNALSTYAVELLQIASNLRENLAAARAREARYGRHDARFPHASATWFSYRHDREVGTGRVAAGQFERAFRAQPQRRGCLQ